MEHIKEGLKSVERSLTQQQLRNVNVKKEFERIQTVDKHESELNLMVDEVYHSMGEK